MVISHRHRYVFVEVPRTGSTAISAELQENYAGESILTKHAYYSTFLETATEDEKSYRVISGIRNPLDDIVSAYRKYSTKDRAYYVGSRRNLRRYDYVQAYKPSFSEFLDKYYKMPYDHWTSTYHAEFDCVIRFENIQEDFSKALEMLGVQQVRPLPVRNRTDRHQDFLSYYSSKDIPKAVWIFGPYMKKWGYEFPSTWGRQTIPLRSILLYKFASQFRKFYWNNVRQSSALHGKMFRKLFLQ